MTRCHLLGHSWRSTSATQANGIKWTTWLCGRCPTTVEYAWAWGQPTAGGIVTRADGALIGVLVVAAALVALIGGRS